MLFQTAILFNITTLAQNKNSAPTNFPEPIFEHLTIEDGLPENSVHCILQDHLGYMWFGTQNGLVRYDGYNMKVYQPDPNDSGSIRQQEIFSIYEDNSGILWIGTGYGGLNRFNRTTETFTRYVHNPNDSTSINSNQVNIIEEDKAGNLFVGTGNGLELFDKQAKTFQHIYYQDSVYSAEVTAVIEDHLTGNIYLGSGNKILIYDRDKQILTEKKTLNELTTTMGEINSFYQAADGAIWIGHSKGLARFNSLVNTIKYYHPSPSLQIKIENNIEQLIEDKSGLIWCAGPLGDRDMGLICFDPNNEQFKIYKSDSDNHGSLSGNAIWSIYEDKSGVLWVGTGWQGLNKWDRSKHKFKRFTYDHSNPGSKRFNTVQAIIEDQEGIIWFGSSNGINSFNRISNEFRNYKYDTEDKDNTVNHIYKDESGIIWFGTTTRGLGKFDVNRGSFKFYSNDPNNSASISLNWVRSILPDKNDILWVGTVGGGLNKFDMKTGRFIRYKNQSNNPHSLSQDEVKCIYKDRKGILWIGTDNGGLNKFDRTNESFESFDLEETSTGSSIQSIYEDKKGNFWVGTYPSGIHLFDRDKGISIDNIIEKDGLTNNQVESILEDDSGNLWISTVNGLSRIDIETRSIKNYFTFGGFEENRYLINSACKTSNGEMLFGTFDGLIMFHPDSIKDDPVPPQVVISKVSLFNKPGKKLKFDGFISELKELKLSYNENDLRFDYVGLHFSEPKKNRYKYELEGFDKEWVDAGIQRSATYTNLSAGEYIFKVKACNADGVWNEEGASIKIIIPPPFWATWWAYSIYILFGFVLLNSIRRYELNRTILKNQHKMDEVKLREREETDKMKSRFFANISHEFRTPLTLILGPAENLISKFQDDEIQKQTSTIRRNANRLLGLINQLLDLSKLEAGKLELRASKSNIVSFTKGMTMSFESVAEGKDITLKVIPEKEHIELYFDKETMTKIMTNLLSNAFKFTKDGGEISVTIDEGDKNFVYIKVRDTGVGIPEEELPKLFDRFYQVDSSQTREHEGTGIGLALTKELVELHHGTITVDSKPGDRSKGGTGWTEFTIELPLGRDHLRDDEIIVNEEPAIEPEIIIDDEKFVHSTFEDNNEGEDGIENKNIVLIVEDNTDVREFIKDSVGKEFHIEEASNGEQGVRKAEQIIPDLIISDVMMPKMDGNELTRILKNDEKTSHIPIILLTAKSEQQSKLEGLETGADDYLTKPFDTKELQIRIKNLINIRKKLQEKYSSADFVPTPKAEENLSRSGEAKTGKLSNLDEKFMSKVIEVIENHLAEEGFSIEQFGNEVGMSRVQLHRKLKALSGKSASHYLRSVRLNKAKQMIKEQKGNISEIAYSVGFSSPQYFTRCFKAEFGFPPSDLTN